jgi:hypothetical protein
MTVRILKSLGVAMATFFLLGFASCEWIIRTSDYPHTSMYGFEGFRGGLDIGAFGAVLVFVVAVALIPNSED